MINRRRVIAAGVAGLSFGAALRSGFAAPPSNGQYRAGEHYYVLTNPVATDDPDHIEVVEVFSYLCIHCYHFDPAVTKWSRELPEDVLFKRSPAVFSAQWKVMAQGFYTAQALGIGERVHKPIFEAIHVRRENLASRTALAKFFAGYGISNEDFDKVWDSFGVRAAVQQAEARGRAWGVTGVPQMIVDGKFRLDGRLVGGNTNMLPAADYLIEQERRALQTG